MTQGRETYDEGFETEHQQTTNVHMHNGMTTIKASKLFGVQTQLLTTPAGSRLRSLMRNNRSTTFSQQVGDGIVARLKMKLLRLSTFLTVSCVFVCFSRSCRHQHRTTRHKCTKQTHTAAVVFLSDFGGVATVLNTYTQTDIMVVQWWLWLWLSDFGGVWTVLNTHTQ